MPLNWVLQILSLPLEGSVVCSSVFNHLFRRSAVVKGPYFTHLYRKWLCEGRQKFYSSVPSNAWKIFRLSESGNKSYWKHKAHLFLKTILFQGQWFKQTFQAKRIQLSQWAAFLYSMGDDCKNFSFDKLCCRTLEECLFFFGQKLCGADDVCLWNITELLASSW